MVTIGGFNGQDTAPTAAQLAKMVADGEIKYVLLGSGGMAAAGGGGSSFELTPDPGARHKVTTRA